MFQRAITFSATLLLAGSAVLVTASPVLAQRGGHGGAGFHASGHGGAGFHAGGGHGGVHAGGYHHGGFGRGYGYRPYYSGYYPYYGGGYSLENAYAGDTPLLGDGVTYDSGYRGLSPQEYQAYVQAEATNNTGAPTMIDTTAYITVRVAAGAEIWFYGTKTNSTGIVRQFQTPPLTPGQRYNYEIRARWSENGHELTQTQKVEVTAGAQINVTFPDQPKVAG